MVEQEFKRKGAPPRHPQVEQAVAGVITHILAGTSLPHSSIGANAAVYSMSRATWQRALSDAGLLEAAYALFPTAPKPLDASRKAVLAEYRACIKASEPPPTLEDLSKKHNISITNISYLIRDTKGLGDQLKELRKEAKTAFAPSQESAWFLGMLVGVGGMVSKSSEIRFSNKKNDPDLTRAFTTIGGKLLAERGKIRESFAHDDEKRSHVAFFSRKGAEVLGKFSIFGFNKTETLKQKHPWALEPEYLSPLLAGIIDSGAVIKTTGKGRGIHFYSRSTLPLLIEYFPCVGIQNPYFRYETKVAKAAGPSGVIIRHPSDLKNIFENVIEYSESRRIKAQFAELVKSDKMQPKQIFPR